MKKRHAVSTSGILVAGFLLVLLDGMFLAAQSQISTGAIQGTVTDESGAVLPGATVTLKHVATGMARALLTDDAGRYTAPLLSVGDYEITVELTGFAKAVRKGYTLALGQTLVANVQLKVAGVEEAVTVSAEAPLVETTRAETSALVDTRAVANLPLNGRRFLDLAFLTPGVYQEQERKQLTFAGQRGINSSINIDGADFNQPFFGGQRGGERTNDAYVLSAAAIQEFQVVRSGFAAEFGRSTGGVVNVITKSGANDFHGGAFYYLRHREFSPRTVFGDDVAPTRQQFGGILGGPIRRDKTFFFTAYDQQAQRQALVSRFDATAGLPANLVGQQGILKSTNDVNTYLAKIDHQLSENTRLSGRYNYSRNFALNATNTGAGGNFVTTSVRDNNGTERDRTHTGVINVNTVLSGTTLNEFRWQYSFEDRPRVNNGESNDFSSKVGPQVQVSGCCFLGGVSFLPIVQNDSILQFADNFSYVKGAHNVKVGFDWNRAHVNQIFRGNWRGVYIFNTIQNFLNNLNRAPGSAADQFRIFFGDGKFVASQYAVAAFVQDTWKVNSRLTLSPGLRYEATLNPQPIAPNPLLPQSASIPNDKAQWQPRLGLSWDLMGDAKTVLRASGGVFYARTPMLLLNQAFNANGNPSVGVSFTLNSAQILAARSVHPEFVFPFVPDSSQASNASYFTAAGIAGLRPDASFFDPDFKNPRSYNASVGIERMLTKDLAVALDWVHANTVHLERIRDANLFPAAIGLDNSTPPQLRPLYNVSVRPNANFNILRSQESSARSNYNSLTLSVNKRFSNRHQFQTSYTLAYNRDDDSNERNFSGIALEDSYNLSREYRWSRNDIRQRWVASGSYDLPFGILTSGILNYRTGAPFSAFTGVDSNRDSQTNDKPIVGGVPLLRNSFRQPNFFTIDLRASKVFRIVENQKVELAFDMFNFTNRHNYRYDVSTNESSASALGSRWGTGQTPLPTFRAIRLPNGSLNRGGARVETPFQLQMSLKYDF
ncbi:MAG: TonB-dependent receptor [Acidobacteria bacterium]|nr:TonB-dependent receptor [Acidobacteriota bacterium]